MLNEKRAVSEFWYTTQSPVFKAKGISFASKNWRTWIRSPSLKELFWCGRLHYSELTNEEFLFFAFWQRENPFRLKILAFKKKKSSNSLGICFPVSSFTQGRVYLDFYLYSLEKPAERASGFSRWLATLYYSRKIKKLRPGCWRSWRNRRVVLLHFGFVVEWWRAAHRDTVSFWSMNVVLDLFLI